MTSPATASYFVRSFEEGQLTSTRLVTGTLVDNDLIRGDDAGESVLPGFDTLSNGAKFEGFLRYDSGRAEFTNGEILATVTFADGTSLTGVRGLMDLEFDGFSGFSNEYFLLDTAALAAVGQTMADVADISRTGFTDHGLNWSDLGFSGTPIEPVLPPPPPPPPVLNRIEGTAGRDRLVGTSGDDLIIANGGNRDTLTGGAGDDTFVFGPQVGNGKRDIAVITDFKVFEDTILLTNGSEIARMITGRTDLTIVLAGTDGDRIILQNIPNSGPLVSIEFTDTPFV